MENKQIEEKSFEQLIVELEQVIRNLENREIALDDAVSNYTKGVELSKKCFELLNKNEKLVVEKMTENGLTKFED